MPKKRTRTSASPQSGIDEPGGGSRDSIVVTESGGQYYLPGQYSNGGNKIFSSSRSFIESIARELSEKGRLNAREFGPYSIYSTYRDSIAGHHLIDMTLIDSLVDTDHVQNSGPCGCIWSTSSKLLKPKYLAMCRELGIREAENVDSPAYRRALLSYVAGIPDHEVTAFVLLNGMRRVPISVSLLWLRGRLDLSDLHNYISAGTRDTGSQITDPKVHRGQVPFGDDRDEALDVISTFLGQMREKN